MVIIKKILTAIGIVILVALIVIPRSYFVNDSTQKIVTTKAVNLTDGPEYVNRLFSNIIEIQAISGDMGNTIEYTIKDLITENEASEILNSDYSILKNKKTELESLKNSYPEIAPIANTWIENINKLQNLNTKALPYIQNFNEEGLKNVETEITYCFGDEYTEINGYKVNQNEYDKALAEATYEYNGAKAYIS